MPGLKFKICTDIIYIYISTQFLKEHLIYYDVKLFKSSTPIYPYFSDRPKLCFTILPKPNRTSQLKFCFPNWNTSVFLSFWVKFWLFKNPYYSSCVMLCPGHVMGTQRLNFWCCFSSKMTAYLKRLFCNLQYKNVCILVGFGPILNF